VSTSPYQLETETNANICPGKALEQHDSNDNILGETHVGESDTAESSSAPAAAAAKGSATKRGKGQAPKASTSRSRAKAKVVATPSAEAAASASTPSSAPDVTAPVAAVAAAVPATSAATAAASDALSRLTLSPSQSTPARPSPAAPQDVLVYPPSPKTIQDLPSSLSELDALLPKFDTPPVDAVEEDAEDELAALALAAQPDFLAYILRHLSIIKTHRNSIDEHQHARLWRQLRERERMLNWYLPHYIRLGRGDTDPSRDDAPMFDPFPDDMDMDLPDPAPQGMCISMCPLPSLNIEHHRQNNAPRGTRIVATVECASITAHALGTLPYAVGKQQFDGF
jgi:hypothetical protein